ncbi:MAG: glycosyl hydrolase [Planctomycetota bacterium]
MLTRRRTLALVAPLFLSFASCFAQSALERSFLTPPMEARPHTWWHWMNGNVTREGITADLEAMKAVGLGGAQIFNVSEGIPEGPILYNTPEWRELVKFAATEASRLGLELCIHDCAGWSSSGGPWVKPEHAMQTVTVTETKVKGPRKFAEVVAQPKANVGFYRDVVILAFPTPKNDAFRIANINAKALREYQYGLQPSTDSVPADAVIARGSIVVLKAPDGKVDWDVPAGDWTIMRIGYTPTGAVNAPSPTSGRGLEVDKLSREAFDAFWAGGMEPLIKELGPLAGKTLNNVLIDSYEVGCQNWTPRFREEFTKRRGYDPLLLLPAMSGRVIGSADESERFLWDLRRTVGDLFADNYYSYFAEICKKNGLLSSVEPYDGPFEGEQVGKDADIVMGEFWSNAGMSSSCKLAAGVAHTYGKKIVGAESFTAFPEVGKWTNTPGSLKAVGDLMYTTGINRYIIHRYAHQPWKNVNPGMTMGQWGTHFERTTTWWEQSPAWLTYLARCQSMLQQGKFVADVCYFAGEASPNGAPFEEKLKSKGYDYDACGTDVVLNRMSVQNGRIVLPDGMSYAMLVLPDTPFMTPRMAAKVKELVLAGATVMGPKPTRSPSGSGGKSADAGVAKIGGDVWGNCDGKAVKEHVFGDNQGCVVWGKDPEQVLSEMKIQPDALFMTQSGGKASVSWIHRAIGDADVYFVSNQKARSVEMLCSFRVHGKAPEIWQADTGTMEPAPVWSQRDSRTVVPIRFGPSGSAFVVFRGSSRSSHVVSVKPPESIAQEHRLPSIEIKKAVYEAVDGAASADVTAKVAAAVASGETEIPATNTMFGDPANLHVKRLRVDYTVDGKAMSKTVNENATLVLVETGGTDSPLPYSLSVNRAGGTELRAYRGGDYELTGSNGKLSKVMIKDIPATVEIGGAWAVKFQKDRGAPESITLDALTSLSASKNAGVRYFSGTAEYEKEFDVPAEAVGPGMVQRLDLGGVKEIAEVTLNGKKLGEGGGGGVWWKAPYEGDVTGIVKAGKNTLSIRVTNTWINRLIGDEQFADDSEWNGITIKKWPDWFKPASDNPLEGRPVKERITFTTWKHWHKGSPLPDSGLLGPVRLFIGERVEIK